MKVLKSTRGEGYIDVVVAVFIVLLFIALAVKVLPVFIAKNQLDTFAAELVREAEIDGQVGSKTTVRAAQLKAQTGLNPSIKWSVTGKIQLNNEVTVTLSANYDIGFFNFGSFPVTLTAKAIGKSEVYWK